MLLKILFMFILKKLEILIMYYLEVLIFYNLIIFRESALSYKGGKYYGKKNY